MQKQSALNKFYAGHGTNAQARRRRPAHTDARRLSAHPSFKHIFLFVKFFAISAILLSWSATVHMRKPSAAEAVVHDPPPQPSENAQALDPLTKLQEDLPPGLLLQSSENNGEPPRPRAPFPKFGWPSEQLTEFLARHPNSAGAQFVHLLQVNLYNSENNQDELDRVKACETYTNNRDGTPHLHNANLCFAGATNHKMTMNSLPKLSKKYNKRETSILANATMMEQNTFLKVHTAFALVPQESMEFSDKEMKRLPSVYDVRHYGPANNLETDAEESIHDKLIPNLGTPMACRPLMLATVAASLAQLDRSQASVAVELGPYFGLSSKCLAMGIKLMQDRRNNDDDSEDTADNNIDEKGGEVQYFAYDTFSGIDNLSSLKDRRHTQWILDDYFPDLDHKNRKLLTADDSADPAENNPKRNKGIRPRRDTKKVGTVETVTHEDDDHIGLKPAVVMDPDYANEDGGSSFDNEAQAILDDLQKHKARKANAKENGNIHVVQATNEKTNTKEKRRHGAVADADGIGADLNVNNDDDEYNPVAVDPDSAVDGDASNDHDARATLNLAQRNAADAPSRNIRAAPATALKSNREKKRRHEDGGGLEADRAADAPSRNIRAAPATAMKANREEKRRHEDGGGLEADRYIHDDDGYKAGAMETDDAVTGGGGGSIDRNGRADQDFPTPKARKPVTKDALIARATSFGAGIDNDDDDGYKPVADDDGVSSYDIGARATRDLPKTKERKDVAKANNSILLARATALRTSHNKTKLAAEEDAGGVDIADFKTIDSEEDAAGVGADIDYKKAINSEEDNGDGYATLSQKRKKQLFRKEIVDDFNTNQAVSEFLVERPNSKRGSLKKEAAAMKKKRSANTVRAGVADYSFLFLWERAILPILPNARAIPGKLDRQYKKSLGLYNQFGAQLFWESAVLPLLGSAKENIAENEETSDQQSSGGLRHQWNQFLNGYAEAKLVRDPLVTVLVLDSAKTAKSFDEQLTTVLGNDKNEVILEPGTIVFLMDFEYVSSQNKQVYGCLRKWMMPVYISWQKEHWAFVVTERMALKANGFCAHSYSDNAKNDDRVVEMALQLQADLEYVSGGLRRTHAPELAKKGQPGDPWSSTRDLLYESILQNLSVKPGEWLELMIGLYQ